MGGWIDAHRARLDPCDVWTRESIRVTSPARTILDMAALAIECDSRRWHSDPLTQQDDADKQAILEAHGIRVLRITWQQAVDHPRQTLRRIRAARLDA